ncbi:retropepsin-like aspartic protease family protein [Ramlibacter sp.]|uniref:retropepsin-like aspartic protease family protein n=1 Tax=Ramlibacter sp. TaxID=1917967 RepID=UPI003D0A2D97
MKSLPALALALALAGASAFAQTVTLQGTMGSRALLIVDGAAPKAVAPGETHKGVRLVSTSGDTAVVDIAGKQVSLRVGDTPVSVGTAAAGGGGGGGGGGRRIVLPVDSGGHFLAQGQINGRAAKFMVDTGASVVALSASDAERMGLNYRAGRQVAMNTANGVAPGWVIRLNSVRIADVEIHDVEAVVTPSAMPFVLLGNSYLNRFQMRRDSDQMVLERRF